MAANEKTSTRLGTLASKAMRTPEEMTPREIKELGATALTQMPDKAQTAAPKKSTKK